MLNSLLRSEQLEADALSAAEALTAGVRWEDERFEERGEGGGERVAAPRNRRRESGRVDLQTRPTTVLPSYIADFASDSGSEHGDSFSFERDGRRALSQGPGPVMDGATTL